MQSINWHFEAVEEGMEDTSILVSVAGPFALLLVPIVGTIATCFAALGAMNSEMKSAKWLWGAIGLQLATGFTVGFLVYQIGTLIVTGSIGAGFAGGLIAVVCFAAIITVIIRSNNKKIAAEYKLG